MKYNRDKKTVCLSLAERNILTYAENILYTIGKLSKEGTDIKTMAYKMSQDLHTIQYYAQTQYFVELDKTNTPLNKKLCKLFGELRESEWKCEKNE